MFGIRIFVANNNLTILKMQKQAHGKFGHLLDLVISWGLPLSERRKCYEGLRELIVKRRQWGIPDADMTMNGLKSYTDIIDGDNYFIHEVRLREWSDPIHEYTIMSMEKRVTIASFDFSRLTLKKRRSQCNYL